MESMKTRDWRRRRVNWSLSELVIFSRGTSSIADSLLGGNVFFWIDGEEGAIIARAKFDRDRKLALPLPSGNRSGRRICSSLRWFLSVIGPGWIHCFIWSVRDFGERWSVPEGGAAIQISAISFSGALICWSIGLGHVVRLDLTIVENDLLNNTGTGALSAIHLDEINCYFADFLRSLSFGSKAVWWIVGRGCLDQRTLKCNFLDVIRRGICTSDLLILRTTIGNPPNSTHIIYHRILRFLAWFFAINLNGRCGLFGRHHRSSWIRDIEL